MAKKSDGHDAPRTARLRRASPAAQWRRRSLDVLTSDVVAGRARGPEPPRAWAGRLRQLVEASRRAEAGPSWWSPMTAYFGSVETRTDPRGYRWDGMKRLRRNDRPLVFFQFTLAGWGQLRALRQAARAAAARHRVLRGRPLAPPLLPAGGVARMDVRLDRHLPPVSDPAHRAAGRRDRAGAAATAAERARRDRRRAWSAARSARTSAIGSRSSWRCSSSRSPSSGWRSSSAIPTASASGCSTSCAAACSRIPRQPPRRRRAGRRARDEPQPLQSRLSCADRPVAGAVHDRSSNPGGGADARRDARAAETDRRRVGLRQREPLRQGVPPLPAPEPGRLSARDRVTRFRSLRLPGGRRSGARVGDVRM